MTYTPLFIPLETGLDISKESTLGGKDLAILENGDFAVDGAIKSRPGRAAPADFAYRKAVASGQPWSSGSFASTGFTQQGLMRQRDASSERALLGCKGRLFSKESTAWEDRGHFACTKVDRLATMATAPSTAPLVGPDFYMNLDATHINTDVGVRLLDSDYSAQRISYSGAGGTSYTKAGGMARCSTSTVAMFKDSSTNLWMMVRDNATTTPTEYQLATDCSGDWDNGLAAQVCCDQGATVLFIIYKTTTADQYKVLRVSTGGTIVATYTGSRTNLRSFWVCNSTTAVNKVIIGLAHSGGVDFKVLTASTMVDAALDSSYVPAGSADTYQVVCGYDTSTRVWFAINPPSSTEGLIVGTLNPAAASSCVSVLNYPQLTGASTYIVHQPIQCGGRMYLTLSGGIFVNAGVNTAGTWVTLDLTNKFVTSDYTSGPFKAPTLAARCEANEHCLAIGPTYTTAPPIRAAVLTSDGTAWTFPTRMWTTFGVDSVGNVAGFDAQWTLVRVAFSGPRAATSGGSTLFSGSVLRELTGSGETYESGFIDRPAVSLTAGVVGGVLTAGSYSVICCWKWVDGSGQVHRSAPSAAQTITTDATHKEITVAVTNPIFTEKPVGDISVEIYCTTVNPTANSLHYLQSTTVLTTPSFTTTPTAIGAATALDLTSLSLYTDAHEFVNMVVQADGGIAALNRRVWVASAHTVYASKLRVDGLGTSWNDEGSLSIDLPAGAGRILALEGMDDKLVVFCQRGVFAIPDSGPDNVGAGPDVATPVHISDLGCAGPRSTCLTDRGVVFCSPLDSADAQRGGPWLLDRSLSITERTYLGRPAFTYFLSNGTWVPEVAYSPERQQLYVTASTLNSGRTGVIVIDFRVGKWSTWSSGSTNDNPILSITCVGGVLWTMAGPGYASAYTACPYNTTNTYDDLGNPNIDPIAMTLKTQHFASNGQDGLGWSRVRGISVLHGKDCPAYTLVIGANLDYDLALSSGNISVAAQSAAASTWPTNRAAPEWRLPQQKCGMIQVTLAGTGAIWSAIRLDVLPLPGRSPTNDRR